MIVFPTLTIKRFANELGKEGRWTLWKQGKNVLDNELVKLYFIVIVLALNSRTHEFLPFDAQLHSENHIGSILLLQSFKAILKTFQIILSIEDIFFKCHRFFWEKNKFNIGKQKPPYLPTEWHLFGLKCNSILQRSKQVVMWFCYGPWEYQTKSSLCKGHTSLERGGANGL